MIECESIMADKGSKYMVKSIGPKTYVDGSNPGISVSIIIIIIIMVIFKCYFSGELIALS